MEWFYDGQVRRYITQTVRAMSNFVVKYGDGTLHRVPVMYGDADRQVASIIRNNSENKVNSVPRISVYVSSLALDRDRTSDQTFVGKVNIRERGTYFDPSTGVESYNQMQGKNYTVERLMPTPFSLKMKIDIWSANTDQKLQILEQILVLFNPSLELQTTDNYIDWTSLSVLNLEDITWDSKQVPVGNDTPISIATLTVQAPIWISPPVKVKHLGVITKIITSMYANSSSSGTYIEGLGSAADPMAATTTLTDLLSQTVTTISGYQIQVYNGQARLLGPNESVVPVEPTLDITVKQGPGISWLDLFEQYPGEYVAGSSQIYLIQPNGSYVVGTIALNPLDYTVLQVNWNKDTLTSNTGIDSQGSIEYKDTSYMTNPTQYRSNSPGTFDAIINPLTYNPYRPTGNEITDQTIIVGLRFLIIEDIGTEGITTPVWGSLVAVANDIIEWTGTQWNVVFNSIQETTTMVWQTNIYTGVQYLWNGVSWVKSFEGEYSAAQWKIIL
jgi:T4-like virus Myoviridae tail sheath stabiliser